MREAASRGFWIASRTPYGYNRIMVQDGACHRGQEYRRDGGSVNYHYGIRRVVMASS